MKLFTAALLVLILVACTTTAVDVPATPRTGSNPNLVDPQLGFSGAATDPRTPSRYAHAVTLLNQGKTSEAAAKLEEIIVRDPSYGPALLVLAELALEDGDYKRARELVDRTAVEGKTYLAADIYRAEIALAAGDRQAAYEGYRLIISDPQSPALAKERYQELRRSTFDALIARAMTEAPKQSITTLREALAIEESEVARILLARRLVDIGEHDQARRELEPILARGGSEKDEVQEILADIDVSNGRYQEAIFRLERLSKRSSDDRFVRRLSEVKRLWSEANMPPQYRRAIESSSINRADFAVLVFWKVSSVRFAHRVGQPPIAVDIADVPGREELVRAMALGLFSVDPITRSVGPYRAVSASGFARLAARVLALRGTLPPCARAVQESNEVVRGQRYLAACGIDAAPLATGDAPLTGAYAAEVLEKIDALMSAE